MPGKKGSGRGKATRNPAGAGANGASSTAKDVGRTVAAGGIGVGTATVVGLSPLDTVTPAGIPIVLLAGLLVAVFLFVGLVK